MSDTHRDLFRKASNDLIRFARRLEGAADGYFTASDIARTMMSAALVTMARDIGREPTVEYLRSLATALETNIPPLDVN
jgi:hypothetical protein